MDDPTRPAPPPRQLQRRPPSGDRPLVDSLTQAKWTTAERLGRRSALTPIEGSGRLRRDGPRIDFRSDDGSYMVTGRVTGAAVVRPWTPWVWWALLLVGVVGTTVGTDLWLEASRPLADSVLFGVVLWLMFVYQDVRKPFVRIDGIDDANRPIVLHLFVKPTNPYRPAAEAEELAEVLRRAAQDALSEP